MAATVKFGQPLACVAQAHAAGTGNFTIDELYARAVVAELQQQVAGEHARCNAQGAAVLGRRLGRGDGGGSTKDNAAAPLGLTEALEPTALPLSPTWAVLSLPRQDPWSQT